MNAKAMAQEIPGGDDGGRIADGDGGGDGCLVSVLEVYDHGAGKDGRPVANPKQKKGGRSDSGRRPDQSHIGIHERKLKPESAGDGIGQDNADKNHDGMFP